MAFISKDFVCKKDGKDVYSYCFKNAKGAEMKITNYGAIIISIRMPDKHNKFDEVVLGYDNVETYIEDNPFYFGCIIGRYANRIKGGSFYLGDQRIQLNCNEGKNHLHGGNEGYHQRVFDGEIKDNAIILTYLSPDGEENYPGNLLVKVRYELTDDNEVHITYEAKSDADTIINLTNHSYFNLNGGKKHILDHILFLDADYYTPTNEELIPTGELKSVKNTPYDFRDSHKISDTVFDFSSKDVTIGRGYDITMVMNGSGLRKVAELTDVSSGRKMDVFTDQPGVQFFTAHIIHPGTIGLGGQKYGPYYGICLEPQVYPDSPNKENFPNCVLRKDEIYTNTCIYKFYNE